MEVLLGRRGARRAPLPVLPGERGSGGRLAAPPRRFFGGRRPRDAFSLKDPTLWLPQPPLCEPPLHAAPPPPQGATHSLGSHGTRTATVPLWEVPDPARSNATKLEPLWGPAAVSLLLMLPMHASMVPRTAEPGCGLPPPPPKRPLRVRIRRRFPRIRSESDTRAENAREAYRTNSQSYKSSRGAHPAPREPHPNPNKLKT